MLEVIQQFGIIMHADDLKGYVIVPSQLPSEAPLLPQYWPEQVPSGQFEVGRIYYLPVALKGFFPRLQYRAYHLGMFFSYSRPTTGINVPERCDTSVHE